MIDDMILTAMLFALPFSVLAAVLFTSIPSQNLGLALLHEGEAGGEETASGLQMTSRWMQQMPMLND